MPAAGRAPWYEFLPTWPSWERLMQMRKLSGSRDLRCFHFRECSHFNFNTINSTQVKVLDFQWTRVAIHLAVEAEWKHPFFPDLRAETFLCGSVINSHFSFLVQIIRAKSEISSSRVIQMTQKPLAWKSVILVALFRRLPVPEAKKHPSRKWHRVRGARAAPFYDAFRAYDRPRSAAAMFCFHLPTSFSLVLTVNAIIIEVILLPIQSRMGSARCTLMGSISRIRTHRTNQRQKPSPWSQIEQKS